MMRLAFHFMPLDFQPGPKVKVSECNPLGLHPKCYTFQSYAPPSFKHRLCLYFTLQSHPLLKPHSAYSVPQYRPVLRSLILQPHLRLGGKSASSVTKPFFCCPLWVLELKEEFRMASPSHSRDRSFSSPGAAFHDLTR